MFIYRVKKFLGIKVDGATVVKEMTDHNAVGNKRLLSAIRLPDLSRLPLSICDTDHQLIQSAERFSACGEHLIPGGDDIFEIGSEKEWIANLIRYDFFDFSDRGPHCPEWHLCLRLSGITVREQIFPGLPQVRDRLTKLVVPPASAPRLKAAEINGALKFLVE